MPIDPAIVSHVIQNVRAEVITPPPAGAQLDPELIERIVARVPLFQKMPVGQLKGLMGLGEPCRFIPGECVFNEGEAGTSFYVLVSGEVAVDKWRNGKNVQLTTLGAGACFGEMALVNDNVRSATVRALGNVVALRFRRELITASTDSALPIYRNIARILAERLGQSNIMLADLSAGAS